MADFNWDEHPIASDAPTDSKASFNWDDHPIAPTVADKIGDLAKAAGHYVMQNGTDAVHSIGDHLKSLVYGAGKGLSMGAAPTAAGQVNALANAAAQGQVALGGDPTTSPVKATALNMLGSTVPLAGAAMAAYGASQNPSDIVKNYIAGRDSYKKAEQAAHDANPYTFNAAELGGGLVGPGELTAGKNLAVRSAKLAGLGAGMGFHNSNADLTKGEYGKAALDTGVGALATPILGAGIEKVAAPALGYLGNKVAQGAGWAGKKALRAGFDTLESDSTRYLNNPDAVNSALDYHGMAQKLADTLGDVKADTGPATEAAMSTLDKTSRAGGMPVEQAIATLRNFKDPRAQDLADSLMSNYMKRGPGAGITGAAEADAGNLTEAETHQVKATLQDLAKWNGVNPSGQEAAARAASGNINQGLKSENMDYRSAMDDLSQNIQSKSDLGKRFALKNDYANPDGSGFTYSDQTIPALKDLAKANKVDRARILESLKNQGYGDLAEDVQNTITKQRLNGEGITNGSRHTLMFGGIGTALGHASGLPGGAFAGGAAGGAFGSVVDKYGPQIAKGGLDATLLANRLRSSPGAQRFIGALQSAAARGPGALASTHFILSQTEPDYQRAVQQE